MEFTSLKQLYRRLLPAFNVKKRLILNSKYKDITNEGKVFLLIIIILFLSTFVIPYIFDFFREL